MHPNLEYCPVFRGLNLDQIQQLLNTVNFREKKYNKEDIIAHSDTECRNFLILAEGSVKGEMVDFTGKTIKIEDIESPRALAPAFLFGSNNRYPVTIVANTSVIIISIPKNQFIKLLQLSDVVLNNFLSNISNRAQFLSNKIRFLSFQTIKGKIAHYILQIVKRTRSDEIVLPKSQNELAELFGVTRPSLGRALRELDHDGYIKATGKHIQILDKEGLSGLLR
ncbi:MAG: Crp/Fnr family transcriptional regulator [Bacteroidales bacterium]|nr:Crp/Fnr family transcriptional regulator [Bacteroidales bacterium]